MTLAPEARCGRYVIRRSIGEGGFGTVHLATDPLLGRDVAIKVPRIGSFLGERMLAEARALARLSHRSIVGILDAGLQGGVPYLVLELVGGPSLEAVLAERRSRPVEPPDALRLLRGPAEALDHAHGAGFLHRDLKPANLLATTPVTRASRLADLELKVADFGLAALAARQPGETVAAGVGDPRYVSPEAWRGQPDGSSDVFSLAAVFFRLVAGAPPLAGATPADVIQAVGRPARRALSELRPDLPRALEAALATGLSARRHERPRTAGELIDRLEDSLRRDDERRRMVADARERIAARSEPTRRTCPSCLRPLSPRATACTHCGD